MDPNCCLSLCRDLRVELDFLLCCIIIIATTITFFFRGGGGGGSVNCTLVDCSPCRKCVR